jgi:hypothetical protein
MIQETGVRSFEVFQSEVNVGQEEKVITNKGNHSPYEQKKIH